MNEHEERDYAARMMCHLNAGLDGLDRDVVEALAAARRHALEHRSEGGAACHRSPVLVDFRYGMAAVTVLTILAATVLMWWPAQRPDAQQTAQLDIGLLTGELPPAAYIDEDFPAWQRLPGLCRS